MDSLQRLRQRHDLVGCWLVLPLLRVAIVTLVRMMDDPRADSIVVVRAEVVGLALEILRGGLSCCWGYKLPGVLLCKPGSPGLLLGFRLSGPRLLSFLGCWLCLLEFTDLSRER